MAQFITSYGDDPQFVDAMNCFIEALVEIYDRPEIYIVRIDNWFDHKWLHFAGRNKSIYAVVHNRVIMCGPTVWKSRQGTTVPPFSPKRVVGQSHFTLNMDGVYQGFPKRLLYRRIKQRSSANLHNKILSFSEEGLFVWLSAGSADSGRPSLLAYHTLKDKVGGWYASFVNSFRWKLNRVKGANREAVDRVFSRDYEDIP